MMCLSGFRGFVLLFLAFFLISFSANNLYALDVICDGEAGRCNYVDDAKKLVCEDLYGKYLKLHAEFIEAREDYYY